MKDSNLSKVDKEVKSRWNSNVLVVTCSFVLARATIGSDR